MSNFCRKVKRGDQVFFEFEFSNSTDSKFFFDYVKNLFENWGLRKINLSSNKGDDFIEGKPPLISATFFDDLPMKIFKTIGVSSFSVIESNKGQKYLIDVRPGLIRFYLFESFDTKKEKFAEHLCNKIHKEFAQLKGLCADHDRQFWAFFFMD